LWFTPIQYQPYKEAAQMARSVIIHLLNEDPIEADMEELPKENSTCIVFSNPRKRDGKNAGWVTAGARSFIFPWSRINFIEVMTSIEEEENIIMPYRR
jgi:hypothetical protein